MRSVFWEAGSLHLIDQRRLPASLELKSYTRSADAASAIRDMVVRGAPAIGVTAAFGLALAARESGAGGRDDLIHDLQAAGTMLKAARPTAVNLGWAIDRILERARAYAGTSDEVRAYVLEQAQLMADEDVEINRRMAQYGAGLIGDGDTIIHHCNTGALAAVDWGTALGAIRMAHEAGKRVHVLVDETRPRLQGARLTAWELEQYRIPYEIITDGMAGHFLRRGEVQEVMFGADRLASNGDVANKIGTYMLALAARDNDVPAYAVVPTSSIDFSLSDGSLIPIEERDPAEVLEIEVAGQRSAPEHARARNPAFDITPGRLISAIVTENGIVRPPYVENLPAVRPA
jgi:methylthioribose-1-phosphate isomerase